MTFLLFCLAKRLDSVVSPHPTLIFFGKLNLIFFCQLVTPTGSLMKRLLLSVVLGFFAYSVTFAQGKLIFAIDIVRHGDRTPLIASPEMEKIWPQGVGQLTPKGMQQEYQLGKSLRQLYVYQYHLLPEHFDINAMNIRSSGMARTMMSAQSILFGLYPLGTGPSLNETTQALPGGFQPIPIYIVPREQDTLLVPNYDKEKYKKLLETYIVNQPEWVQKDLELKPNYPTWSKIAGMQINNLFDLMLLSDRLLIERLYSIPLANGLNENEADVIVNAGKWAWLTVVNHPKFALIVGSELAQTIKHELNKATEKNSPLKYLLFVAHDSTLAAQLKVLGQTLDDTPPYASRINYSLFDMGSSNYEVRVTYNKTPLFIDQCGGNTCTLSEFVNLIDNQINNAESSVVEDNT